MLALYLKISLTALLFLFGPYLLFAQMGGRQSAQANDTARTVLIDKIFIIGNKKTKEQIISRELSMYNGQELSLTELHKRIEADKRKLFNTGLFLSVEINIIDLSPYLVDIIIRVSERWYFFPVPIFELADRNFTEWWVNQNADFSRVEWGLKLRHFNFRGRREILNLTAQFGFTKLFMIAYQFPYIDRKQKLGLGFYGDYATNKNIAYRTLDHRQQFLDSEDVLRERWRAGVNLSYRPNFYSLHSLGLNVSSINIADTVALENPDYFLNGALRQQFFSINYIFTWDFRDYVAYPLSGAYFKLQVNKIGLGIFDDVNIFSTTARYSRYFDLGKKFYFGSSVTGMISFPENQPFYNFSGVGLSKVFVRGFEKYIIEGQHFIIQKNNLKRQLFAFETDISNIFSAKQFNKIPISGYLSLNFDHGYVVNYPNNSLNTRFSDRYIFGGGIGFDLVTFYDFVMRWEYSFNADLESGIFLNIHAAF